MSILSPYAQGSSATLPYPSAPYNSELLLLRAMNNLHDMCHTVALQVDSRAGREGLDRTKSAWEWRRRSRPLSYRGGAFKKRIFSEFFSEPAWCRGSALVRRKQPRPMWYDRACHRWSKKGWDGYGEDPDRGNQVSKPSAVVAPAKVRSHRPSRGLGR